MKALFGRNQKNVYPEHHDPDFSRQYYSDQSAAPNVSHLHDPMTDDRQYTPVRRQQNPSTDRARSTLDALQMIRRRFEENNKEVHEGQAAA